MKQCCVVAIISALVCAGAIAVGGVRARTSPGLVSDLAPRAQVDDAPIMKAVWSPDGTMLAIPTPSNIYLYAAGYEQPRILTGMDTISQLVFSPDSQSLAAVGFRIVDNLRVYGVWLWDVKTGELMSRWELNYVTTTLTFTPDGAALGVLAWNYDMSPSDIVRIQSLDNTWATTFAGVWSSSYTQYIAFSPDQALYTTISYVSQNGSGRLFPIINVWDSQTGALQHEMWMEGSYIAQLAFDPRNNGRLASLQEKGVVRFWNAQSGDQLFALTLPYERVSAVTFSDDGAQFATGGPDGVVRLWDSNTGAMLAVIEGPARTIDRIDYLSDGTLAAYGIIDGTARKWDVRTGEDLLVFDLGDSAISESGTSFVPSLASKSSQTLLTRAGDDSPNTIQVQQDEARILTLVWSPDGTQLVAGTTDGADVYTVTGTEYEFQWRAEAHTSGQTFPGSDHWITAGAFSPDGQILALAEGDGLVQIWDTQQIIQLTIFQDNDAATQTLAFSPDGETLAAGGGYFPSRFGADYVIHLWDTTSWTRREYTEVSRFGEMGSIAFSADRHYLAYGGIHGYLPICDASFGELITAIHPEPESVDELAFSPDGRYLAFSGRYSVQLWELHHDPEFHLILRRRWTFNEHDQAYWEWDEWPLTTITFRTDGHMLFATSTATGKVRVWDTAANAIIAEFAQTEAAIWTASFDPAGERLAAADEHGTIYLWTLSNLEN
jgi:WD40 repeat protein